MMETFVFDELIYFNFLFLTAGRFLSSLEALLWCNNQHVIPAEIISRDKTANMFKVNNRNTRKRCEMCSKLTIKTPERCHRRRSGVFIVNFEHILHHFLVFLLLILNK